MDRENPYEIAEAIGRLGLWEAAARHNWAIWPRGDNEPWLVSVANENQPDVKARIFLFHGWRPFHCFLVARANHDFWVAASPADITHLQVLFPAKGAVQIHSFEEGYAPVILPETLRPVLAKVLYECFGLFMRFESDEQLAMKFVDEKALFSRRELDDGKWEDYGLPLPDPAPSFVERVSLAKDLLARAADLPFDSNFKLELDFARILNAQMNEPHPRALFMFAAVDIAAASRFLWRRMVVSGKPDGLLALWQSLAQTLLERIVVVGKVPGEIHVRSMRMVRFLRPLAMHLPFKLVVNARLPVLEAEIGAAIENKSL